MLKTFLVRAPDYINGDGSASAAGGAAILDSDNFEVTHATNEKIWWNFFLAGIDSEWFETYFEPIISKSKIFSRVKFFLGLCRFSAKKAKRVKK